MACEHKRIKSVNCHIFCDICGIELPADFLTGKNSPEPADAAKTPEKGAKTKTSRKKVKA